MGAEGHGKGGQRSTLGGWTLVMGVSCSAAAASAAAPWRAGSQSPTTLGAARCHVRACRRAGRNPAAYPLEGTHATAVTGEAVVVRREPDLAALRPELQRVLDSGIRSVAVVLKHAAIYPAHEHAVGELAREMGFTQVRARAWGGRMAVSRACNSSTNALTVLVAAPARTSCARPPRVTALPRCRSPLWSCPWSSWCPGALLRLQTRISRRTS